MAVINITKTSGILLFTSSANTHARYYTYATAEVRFAVSDDNARVDIVINRDAYSLALAELQVNGQTPTTGTTAKALLHAIFGT